MPGTRQRRVGEAAGFRPLWAFAGLTAAAALVLLITFSAGGAGMGAWTDWLAAGPLRDAVASSAEVVAAVLAIAVTVVAIVVELAANRYSHLITRLFVREPANFLVLGLFVVTTLQCIWFAPWEARTAVASPVGSLVTLLLVTLSLLALLPYVYYVFNFLSPISIIDKIYDNALRTMRRAARGRSTGAQDAVRRRSAGAQDAVRRRSAGAQDAVCRAVDELQDVARSAIVRGDRDIAMAAVDALAELILQHARLRDELPGEWFAIDGAVARDPDFVALADETVAEIAAQRTWLEAKIFRRLLALVGQSTGHLRDVANLVAIHTKLIAMELGVPRAELMTLCVRAFNSYLRTTINGHDMRTAYYIQNQYRLVAERLLRAGDTGRVDEIAGHLEHYGQLAYRAGMPFLLETAAHDIAQLIAAALDTHDAAVDRLLARLLDLDQEVREEAEEESLLGVRRAQIRTAALLIERGHDERARRIAQDLRLERWERLERLRQGLLTDERAQYWELIDRGMNFAYLAPELRRHLPTLFGWLRPEDGAPVPG